MLWDVELWQPWFPPDGPDLIGWFEQARLIKAAERELHLLAIHFGDMGTAQGAELASTRSGALPAMQVAADSNIGLRKNDKRLERCRMRLAACQAMAQSGPERLSANFEANCSARTSARETSLSHISSLPEPMSALPERRSARPEAYFPKEAPDHGIFECRSRRRDATGRAF